MWKEKKKESQTSRVFLLVAFGLHTLCWCSAVQTPLFSYVDWNKTGDIQTDMFLAGLMRPETIFAFSEEVKHVFL